MSGRTLLLLLVGLAFGSVMNPSALARPDAPPGAEAEAPLVGRPADYSGAIGQFRVEASATPTRLHVGEAIRFTMRVRGRDPVVRPPDFPDLGRVPSLKDRFGVEPLSAPAAGASKPGEYLFEWRLLPRKPGATAVPSIPFVYYQPAAGPIPGRYQTLYTKSIPIDILPADEIRPEDVAPGTGPDTEFLLEPLPAESLMERAPLPGIDVLTGLAGLVLPAAGFLVWLLATRSSRLALRPRSARHRSLAAREALHQLASCRGAEPAIELTRTYLMRRLGLSEGEFTPGDVERRMESQGADQKLRDEIRRGLERMDAIRFGSGTPDSHEEWAATTRRLIELVEDGTCP